MKLITARKSKGFTLIELLVVIGILAILLTIVLVAVNPARQFAQANNTKRRSDITQILNAIGQYSADNRGVLPAGIPEGTYPTNALKISDTANQANICSYLTSNYISALPSDPKAANGGVAVITCTSYDTEYAVVKDTAGRVTVGAPKAEAVGGTTPVISITR